jgi:pimeloyl-ACP methyl ester carboxylesterase
METQIEIRPGRTLTITIHKNEQSKKTAFLIHGLGGRPDQWKEQITILKENYTLIIPHLLGHGDSPKPEPDNSNPYSFAEMSQDVQAIFKQFKSEENIVLGHSYGGALAVAVTMANQNTISRSILIDPIPCATKQQVPLVYRLPVCILEILRPLLDKMFQKAVFDKSADPLLMKEEGAKAMQNKMFVIKAMIQGMSTIPIFDITKLKVPTLIIIGESDLLVPPKSIKQFYQAIPNHQFQIIPQASHLVLLEKPDAVNQVIMKFLS